MQETKKEKMKNKTKNRLYEIIFEADTRLGKAFDVFLLFLILCSIVAVMLESVQSIEQEAGMILRTVEWVITFFFTIEYFLRIYVVNKPRRYIFSFYGIIDFLSILPTYLGLFIAGGHNLVVIRALRLLRIFRIFKLTRYTNEGKVIMDALKSSRPKISVFMFGVLTIIIIIGTIMYLLEGSESGFTSIPRSIYWAVVTLTTVGYGDIAPQTTSGQFVAGFVMILGYAIIAVPSGIVTVEYIKKRGESTQVCPDCLKSGHDPDAEYCKFCGSRLNP